MNDKIVCIKYRFVENTSIADIVDKKTYQFVVGKEYSIFSSPDPQITYYAIFEKEKINFTVDYIRKEDFSEFFLPLEEYISKCRNEKIEEILI